MIEEDVGKEAVRTVPFGSVSIRCQAQDILLKIDAILKPA